MECAHKIELSMNTLYALCECHMRYFITTLTHQNFNPCINPTILMDVSIPIGTFHGICLITESYATYLHT
jgi:hypothetical protein